MYVFIKLDNISQNLTGTNKNKIFNNILNMYTL